MIKLVHLVNKGNYDSSTDVLYYRVEKKKIVEQSRRELLYGTREHFLLGKRDDGFLDQNTKLVSR